MDRAKTPKEMKVIKLTQGQVAMVDDDMYDYLNQWKWTAVFAHKWYALRRITVSWRKRKNIYMHRLIMNTLDGVEVDHIDGNTLNNQKENLRNCSHLENGRNKKPVWGLIKYRGVHHQGTVIRAQIRVNYKLISLGCFSTDEEAARAYDEAAIKYFGEYANLNFK